MLTTRTPIRTRNYMHRTVQQMHQAMVVLLPVILQQMVLDKMFILTKQQIQLYLVTQ